MARISLRMRASLYGYHGAALRLAAEVEAPAASRHPLPARAGRGLLQPSPRGRRCRRRMRGPPPPRACATGKAAAPERDSPAHAGVRSPGRCYTSVTPITERVPSMRKTLQMLALLLAAVPALAIDPGQAEGALVINSQTINLVYCYAVGNQRNDATGRQDDIKIVLVDKPPAPDAE